MSFIIPDNFVYDIGSTFTINNKTYVVKEIDNTDVTIVRCKYCPFKNSNCNLGLSKALNLPPKYCVNIITMKGRMEPIKSIELWGNLCKKKIL